MSDVIVRLLKNGPLQVEGKVQLVDVLGNEIPAAKEKIFLCRCGHSSNKPFCDGTHKKVGFVHEEGYTPKVS